MPDIKQILNDEIRRLARKEVKQALLPLLKVVSDQKVQLRELKKEIAELKKTVGSAEVCPPVAVAEQEDDRKLRLNAAGIARIRTKLELTQGKFAALLGVSPHTVCMWEADRVAPRKNMKKIICELRTIGKRELAKRLEALAPADENVAQ